MLYGLQNCGARSNPRQGGLWYLEAQPLAGSTHTPHYTTLHVTMTHHAPHATRPTPHTAHRTPHPHPHRMDPV